MADKIYAKMEDLEVTWTGLQKTKTGKEFDTCQVMSKSPDGRVAVIYLGGKEAGKLRVGDKIDAQVAVRAFGERLFCDLMSFEFCAPSSTDKKLTAVSGGK